MMNGKPLTNRSEMIRNALAVLPDDCSNKQVQDKVAFLFRGTRVESNLIAAVRHTDKKKLQPLPKPSNNAVEVIRLTRLAIAAAGGKDQLKEVIDLL